MAENVRIGLIGAGGIGSFHSGYLKSGNIKRCVLTAVADVDPKKLKTFEDTDVKTFTDSSEMIKSGLVDAVLIATPHYFHTTTGIEAFNNNLHVLVEKPISVHKADCERLIAARGNKNLVFAAMFNLRTTNLYKKIKHMVSSGELGELLRVSWTVTDWFRTEIYYASGGWRATWKGEGGGVLLNQCPHQLDVFQWICGMPTKVRAFCKFGSRHGIEVEDQVTSYFEYANGATGLFIASTGEAPGVNRLELAGDRGLLVVENGKVTFKRTEVSVSEFLKTSDSGFAKPDIWKCDVEISDDATTATHEIIVQNFVDAILDGTPVIAPGEEGANSVELSNAMIYSTLTDSTIDIPMDSAAYEKKLNELIANSTFEKKTVEKELTDMVATFHKH